MKITKDLERNLKTGLLLNVLEVPVIVMDDLNKDERIHDSEAQKKLSPQPPSSSKSMLPETSDKIRTSAWITLAILGSTILITMYGETMLLPGKGAANVVLIKCRIVS